MKRKKIWEIHRNFHCSIIGTCLDLEEVEKAFAKADLDIGEGYSDYDIHGMAVGLASEASRFSNKLNEMLDKKHRLSIFTASKHKTSGELGSFWEDSYEKGDIAGGYWALMSHPHSDSALVNHAFGQVHMLSHIAGAGERTRREELNRHIRQIEDLTNTVKDYKGKLAEVNGLARTLKNENGALKKLNGQLRKENELLKDKVESPETKETDSSRVHDLKVKLQRVSDQYRTYQGEIKSQTEDIEILKEYNTLLQELLANAYQRQCEDCENECEHAGTQNLNKKTVLLVGGRLSVVPQYRSLIEMMNGNCIHHDGGQEQSMTVLINLVPKADIIVCFLNCVSHNACNCVKKVSTSKGQRVIMLKTSGITSFKRELEKQAS